MPEDPFDRIVGTSRAAEMIRQFGRRAAAVDAPVLLLGESGTGKGVLARAIHDGSPRCRAPYVQVNCAAVPESLFESEFFGHVRGAFTGAQYAHKGLFEQAHGGTLFLDEIGELPLSVQAKLLTTIEDGCYRRVGGERVASSDTRIIAATSAALEGRVRDRRFRADLFYRLRILAFTLPPLRERAEDVVIIARACLQQIEQRYQRTALDFSRDAVDYLMHHEWQGNIRELRNAIEAAVVAASTDIIDFTAADLVSSAPCSLREVDATSEQQIIALALARAKGNKTRAAAALGIGRTTLWQKLKRINAEGEHSNDG